MSDPGCRLPAIVRWSDVTDRDRDRTLREIEAIFFEASATRSFASEAARRAFQERWLGRYLASDPDLAYVALAADGTALGYLVGALDDPARSPRYADIGYFAALAALTARYPAHLHVNLAPQARGHGLGARLVDRFVRDARAARAPGLHVVTGRTSRNVSFYERNGFAAVATLDWNGRPIVMLARALTA